MPGYQRFLASSISFLILIIFFMTAADAVAAQTAMRSPVPPADKLKEHAASNEKIGSLVGAQPAPNGETAQAGSLENPTAGSPASNEPAAAKAVAEPANGGAQPPAIGEPGNAAAAVQAAQCKRTINADVVAIGQPIMLNRLGAAIPGGLIFALRRDTVASGNEIKLKPGKRPRPLVLRANVGDCLKIAFQNAIPLDTFKVVPASTPPQFTTSQTSLHVQGLEWVAGAQDDGSFVGRNETSLATAANPGSGGQSRTYTLFAKAEGTYLLYTMGDTSSLGNQLAHGLFGAVNVQPAGAEWYRSQVSASDLLQATFHSKRLGQNTLRCNNAGTDCTFTFRAPRKQVKVKQTPAGYLYTLDNHPLIDYNATFADGTPVLKMLNAQNQLMYSDLTAMITGPNAGRFPGTTGVNRPEPACNAENNPALNPPPGGRVDPLFCANPAAPDRKQPYREITILYHGALGGNSRTAVAAQAFPAFADPGIGNTLIAGQDAFAINYGTGGIGAEVYANRIGVGPMGDCIDCKFEEFFLSAWTVADPAMIVDKPANSNDLATQPITNQNGTRFAPPCDTTAKFQDFANDNGCHGQRTPATGVPYTMKGKQKATAAFFPEDPSNVYHSYINDHVKFRILHGGRDVSHVHHQHAHQWLQSPNSDQGSYLDSQMISPGASYTLEMVYNGSGNRNKVVGDSIFHCHFYPHFAAGMWAMWRTHDTFESGTYVLKNGQAVPGSRALPDGEIIAGVPTPAIVPLPTLPMAPLPGYAQIQNNVPVNGVTIPYGGQIVIGGVCQSNKINNLDVIGGCTNGQVLNGTVINSDFDGTTMTGQFQPSTGNALINPGFPYFIPGVAGARAPHPPMDFAPDGAGGFLDGGLPRHVITGGSIKVESHDTLDWSKDVGKADAVELPEAGTKVENAAIDFFRKRCYPTSFPDGTPGSCPSSVSTPPQSTLNTPPTGFVVNGLPIGPQLGAPFADPAVDDNGKPVGLKRTYKAAAFQVNVTLNKKGWHFPQQRMLSLWQDVQPTFDFTTGKPGRQPEPFFFRGNTGDIIEYWHTNLVPNYYLVDDFQVRTPTDILGQHIHLVKFDVTSSDGAGNGFNYEDGTFSPEEVQELIHAINDGGGLLRSNGTKTPLGAPKPPPSEIFNCAANPTALRCQPCQAPTVDYPQCQSWLGAQTTVQRWYLDPLVDNSGVDRTLRTVFTHDHFGPSTHQQAGLYAGLVVEPMGSSWRNSEDGSLMGRPADQPPIRPDGGPTSWKADIITRNTADSYREFVLEFQDLQLAYATASTATTSPPITKPSPDPKKGWIDPAYAINAPSADPTKAVPNLVSTGMANVPPGTQSVNYLNEPIAWRVGQFGDMSYAYDSSFKLASNLPANGDPGTPLLRAYQNDNVQIRTLVGAHVFSHQFNLEGPTWFAEPSWKNSGYRSAQAMGLSEHFELLFKVPPSSAPSTTRKCPDGMSQKNCVDYLYSPSLDISGVANGMWGLFRSYDPTATATKLQPLPNNPIGPTAPVSYATCPGPVDKVFNITAVTSQKALANQNPFPGTIVFNSRFAATKPLEVLTNTNGVMYVRTEDLQNGALKPGVPVEPLILRANAGDCIEINLTNDIDPSSNIFKEQFFMAPPFNGTIANQPVFQSKMSSYVGLHPQLLSYDASKSYGFNVGWNAEGQPQGQAVGFGKTIKYQWYAGKIERAANGTLAYTPVEFGSLNLFPADPVYQHLNGMFGSMIIEPRGAQWKPPNGGCGEPSSLADCDSSSPTTRAAATIKLPDGSFFREFAVMISDDIRISPNPDGTSNSSAVNYRTEPWRFRYAGNATQDFSCMLSNELVGQLDPQTPIFAAGVGDKVRFRLTHPFGTGTSQVFSLHGHVWQRNPYAGNSSQVGNQPLSQWIGSRDNHGSTDHFDLVVDKAGGEGGRAGDYLYTVFQPLQARVGAWGVFRVGTVPQGAPSNNPACKVVPAPPSYVAPATDDDLKRFVRGPLNTSKK